MNARWALKFWAPASIAVAAAGLTIACGESDDADPPNGSGGRGGSSGAGGSAPHGGTSGRGGARGDAGGPAEGGSNGNGDAGESGSSSGGDAGTGGTAAGTAGEGGAGGNVCTGDITISNDAELGAFAARDCEVLEGTLTISSLSLRNLDALAPSGLRVITESLLIDGNTRLTTIAGLSALERVSGSLAVTDNTVLIDLDGLETLDRLGSNAAANTLVFSGNAALRDVSALGNVSQALVSVVVTGNSELTSLTGIVGIRAAQNVTIAQNPALAEIGGLGDVEDCENLTLASNGALETALFPALERAGSLGITGNGVLQTISFPALGEVTNTFTVAGNPELTSLGSLDALASAGSLVITGNPMLPQCAVDALDARLMACNGNCTGNDTTALCN